MVSLFISVLSTRLYPLIASANGCLHLSKCLPLSTAVQPTNTQGLDHASWSIEFCDYRVCAGQKNIPEELETAARFDSTSADLEEYFGNVYGASIHTVNASRLGFFWDYVPQRRNLTVIWTCIWCRSFMFEGLSWAPAQDAKMNPSMLERCPEYTSQVTMKSVPCDRFCQTDWAVGECYDITRVRFPGFFVHRLNAQTVVPHDLWVEVMHIARIDDQTNLARQSTVGQVWFWMAEGSGIWLNVGRSLVAQQSAQFSCREARRMGYDSIQIPGAFNGFVFELVECRGQDLPNSEETWMKACPPPHVKLMTGVPRHRYAPALDGMPSYETVCLCEDNGYDHLNCARQQ